MVRTLGWETLYYRGLSELLDYRKTNVNIIIKKKKINLIWEILHDKRDSEFQGFNQFKITFNSLSLIK